ASSVIRIAGGLAIAYGVTALLGIDGVPRKVILLSSSMPSAVINFVICQRYNMQSDLVASIIATSTLISIVTTPIIIMFIL
ncbi:MAG: AEC family transporter, partial [Proteobacteria bacterium]|nr:AEC family transporter [Pseudomonadota bacterium]